MKQQLSIRQLIVRLAAVAGVLHLVYIAFMYFIIRNAQGFDALGYIFPIFLFMVGLAVTLAWRVTRLPLALVLLSVFLVVVIWSLLNRAIADQGPYSFYGLFPEFVLEDNLEYIGMFPIAFGISILYNYMLFVLCFIIPTKIFRLTVQK